MKKCMCVMVIVLLAISVAQADLKVDLGEAATYDSGGIDPVEATYNYLQEGWQPFTRIHNNSWPEIETFVTALGTDPGSHVVVEVQVQPDSIVAEPDTLWYYPGGPTFGGTLVNMDGPLDLRGVLTDCIFQGADDSHTIRVTLKNLKAGTYSMTSYHHVNLSAWAGVLVDIYANGVLVKSGVAVTTSANPTLSDGNGMATFDITPDGNDEVVVDFTVNGGSAIPYVLICGFEIPYTEPISDPELLELKADIGDLDQKVASVWEDYTLTHIDGDPVDRSSPDIARSSETRRFPLGSGSSYSELLITIEPETTDNPIGYNNNVHFANDPNLITGGAHVGMNDLLKDRALVHNNNMLVTISGLVGSFNVKTYHHNIVPDAGAVDPNNPSVFGNIDIAVDDADGDGVMKVSDLVQTTGTTPAEIATATFDANAGTGQDVVIRLQSKVLNSWVILNAIEITQTVGPCGTLGTVYFPGDITGPENKPDCRVDLLDFALLVKNWMECSLTNQTYCP